jgi:hypothetical protein
MIKMFDPVQRYSPVRRMVVLALSIVSQKTIWCVRKASKFDVELSTVSTTNYLIGGTHLTVAVDTVTNSIRLYFLDNLRTFVVILVIVLHGSMSYMAYAPHGGMCSIRTTA